MPELTGAEGELRMTLQITSKETGETKEVELVGFVRQSDMEAYLAACQKLKEQSND